MNSSTYANWYHIANISDEQNKLDCIDCINFSSLDILLNEIQSGAKHLFESFLKNNNNKKI